MVDSGPLIYKSSPNSPVNERSEGIGFAACALFESAMDSKRQKNKENGFFNESSGFLRCIGTGETVGTDNESVITAANWHFKELHCTIFQIK